MMSWQSILTVSIFPFACWMSGTPDGLVFPLFLIWIAIAAPHMYESSPEWVRKSDRLEKFRELAHKFDNTDLVEEITSVLQVIHEWNTPATIGAVKQLLGKSDVDLHYAWEVEKRILQIEKQIDALKKSKRK